MNQGQTPERVTPDTFKQTSNELVTFMYLRQNELYEVNILPGESSTFD